MKPRILFIGGTPRGLDLMRHLIKNKETVVFAIITKEAAHEPLKVSQDILKLCHKNKIPALITNKIGDRGKKKLLSLKPDVGFVCGWRVILPTEFYKKIPHGCLAAHDSLLPKYRGFAPTAWALINGEPKGGVTLFKIDEQGVDAGDIFAQETIKYGKTETAEDIYPKVKKATLKLFLDFLKAYKKGKVKFRKQNHAIATYTCKRTPLDGEINWNGQSTEIFNLIRALTPPYPYSWTTHKGEKIYIKKATLPKKSLKYDGNIPGRISSITKDGALVLCQKGQIVIKEVIDDKGKSHRAQQFFKSIAVRLGK